MITLEGMQLSGYLATEMFGKMLNVGLRGFAMYLREEYGSEVVRSFLHFIKESSVYAVGLFCQPDDWISMEALKSICEGVLNSPAVVLRLDGLRVQGDNSFRVHDILAEMILDSSSSIQSIQVVADVPGDISLQLLSCALCQHPAIQNLDVAFRTEGQQEDELVFDRNPWWKRLLAMDDLPLKLWALFWKRRIRGLL